MVRGCVSVRSCEVTTYQVGGPVLSKLFWGFFHPKSGFLLNYFVNDLLDSYFWVSRLPPPSVPPTIKVKSTSPPHPSPPYGGGGPQGAFFVGDLPNDPPSTPGTPSISSISVLLIFLAISVSQISSPPYFDANLCAYLMLENNPKNISGAPPQKKDKKCREGRQVGGSQSAPPPP